MFECMVSAFMGEYKFIEKGQGLHNFRVEQDDFHAVPRNCRCTELIGTIDN